MFKYRISVACNFPIATITKVEIQKESETSVWVKDVRHKKFSNIQHFYGTYEEAYDTLKRDAEFYLDQSNDKVIHAKKILSRLDEMKNNL